jgi:hypothetical protein
LLVFSTLLSACDSNYPVAAKPPQSENVALKQVQAVTATKMPLERTINVLGSLAAYDQATLSTKTPGRVSRISVDFGSIVEQGQTIVQIEPRDYQLQVQQAEAALAQARGDCGDWPCSDGNDLEPGRYFYSGLFHVEYFGTIPLPIRHHRSRSSPGEFVGVVYIDAHDERPPSACGARV